MFSICVKVPKIGLSIEEKVRSGIVFLCDGEKKSKTSAVKDFFFFNYIFYIGFQDQKNVREERNFY
jgi:hypothetical protein